MMIIQVVQSIKASCEMHSGELVLVVRQNGRFLSFVLSQL